MSELHRVLIVDDDDVDREHVRRLIGGRFEVVEAGTTAAALEALAGDAAPDCVLLDFRLPDRDGLDVLPAIARRVPVIFVTGDSDEKILVESMQKGAVDFVRKDALNRSRLLRAIGNAIEKAQMKRQIEQQQAAINQAQRMESVGRLAGGIAHDFNNLLTIIRTYCTFAEEALPEGHEALEDLDNVQGAAKRATALTRKLLTFSRKQAVKPRVINVGDTVRDMEQIIGRTLPESIEMNAIQADELWNVRVDPTEFEQVLLNLCVNAGHAMPDGGRLEISTVNATVYASQVVAISGPVPEGDYVLLSVADTGTGIPPDVLPSIFEPFFTTKEVGKGTGLGLATCYGIVKQADGWIAVSSKVGEGTRFSIFLPRVRKPVDEAQRQAAVDALNGSERILIVEDDSLVLASVQRVLTNFGYAVTSTTSVREALKYMSDPDASFDVLMTDVVMPGMSGVELAQQIRGQKPDIKVLFMSGYPDADERVVPTDAGTDFIAKPFTPQDLAQRIRLLIEP